jgi:hypothetical protein
MIHVRKFRLVNYMQAAKKKKKSRLVYSAGLTLGLRLNVHGSQRGRGFNTVALISVCVFIPPRPTTPKQTL